MWGPSRQCKLRTGECRSRCATSSPSTKMHDLDLVAVRHTCTHLHSTESALASALSAIEMVSRNRVDAYLRWGISLGDMRTSRLG